MRRQRRRDGVLPKPSPAGVGYAKTTSIRPSYETEQRSRGGQCEDGQGTRPSGMAARSTTKTAHHKHGRALAPVYRYFTEVLRLVDMGYPGAHGVKCGKSVSCLGSPGLGERVLRGKTRRRGV
ncbi:uncharacterized protein CCOS01_03087 [Colletotrichum costaricense]|uniref:Uncharacterized protein n=1 Tax=Colletotrichum costaricense TaxID=1209916 RepID=A0AAJ0E3T6_9PEZI|nr:uncharacterized protein CCOS01_03087 [Colletotrichum costaricense]KAK1534335.1 hypothetical protein CCOS01_03087 [Colletotrichum costaricense]